MFWERPEAGTVGWFMSGKRWLRSPALRLVDPFDAERRATLHDAERRATLCDAERRATLNAAERRAILNAAERRAIFEIC